MEILFKPSVFILKLNKTIKKCSCEILEISLLTKLGPGNTDKLMYWLEIMEGGIIVQILATWLWWSKDARKLLIPCLVRKIK